MRARRDHHADGHRGGAPARWRVAAAVVAAAALSLAAGAVPAPAAGGYTVTATIPVGSYPLAVAVDPAAGTVYVTSALPGGTVSVITHPVITTTSPLPPGTPYTTTLHAAGGISPWTWAVTGGSLPAGLTPSPGGTITGTPAAPGTRTFTAQATDHDGNTATMSLTLIIDAPDLAITLANPQPFRALHAGAYQVTVTNTGTAAEPGTMVHVDLARGLVPARAGGSGWTCRASLSLRTETCASTTPLAPATPPRSPSRPWSWRARHRAHQHR